MGTPDFSFGLCKIYELIQILRTALAKRIGQVAKTRTKFADVAQDQLSDVQRRSLDCKLRKQQNVFCHFRSSPNPKRLARHHPRLSQALQDSVTSLEETQSELSSAYSKGVVEGFTSAFLGVNLMVKT